MTGVDILATEEVAVKFAFNSTAFWISTLIIFGVLLIVGVILSIRTRELFGFAVFLITGLIIGPLLGTMMASGLKTPTEYETQYKVTVSDEVSMTEFNERYEIIETEGKIYTVREKKHDQ